MRLPAGVRDWLPAELRRKREVESRIRGVFGRWSYDEVQTPGFEFSDEIEAGLGHALARQTFQLVDRRGMSLTLRPEMTTPIARLVSTRMRDEPLPLRLSYVAPVFRYEEPQEGRTREFTQAGVEIIGASSVDADAETLFMAFEMFDEIGLRDAHIDVNNSAVVDGVLATLGADAPEIAGLKALIAQRNLVGLREKAANTPGLTAQAAAQIHELTLLRGGLEMVDRLQPLCGTPASRDGLERLGVLLKRAKELGYGDRLTIDFALLRDLNYYTGLLFEGYIADLGFSLCGGGRYDALLDKFGFPQPAVGWSASVERLLIALERRRVPSNRRPRAIDVLVSGSDVVAARERAAGHVVRVNLHAKNDDELVDAARAAKIPKVLIAENGSVRERHVTW